ncbi:MAG: N-acetyltransferase [Gammaproteobacteria bacterium]
MDRFIRVPWDIYADDICWIPPLRLERRLHFSRLNPFFKHAQWQAWIAYHDNKPVGRICAHIDEVHRKHHGPHTGHFGLIEAGDDPAVFRALLQVSENWLTEREAKFVTGPFNFSINQECGVLVDGFNTPPVIMMPHSREWYGRHIEEQGYAPAMDLLAYWIDMDFEPSRVMQTLAARFSRRIKLRALNRKKFGQELETIRRIFNDAWSRNWGFIPFSKEEFTEMGNSLRLIVPDDFIQIAELDGSPAAFIVVLPNLNEVFSELDGSVFPLGWLKLVKRLKQKNFRSARVPLMGVLRQYQNTPLGIALALLICNEARHRVAATGITGVEMSWILENNKGMRSILDNVGGIEYKRYRIYDKTL